MTSSVTRCDVPGCVQAYELLHGVSINSDHPYHKWTHVNGRDICPPHALELIERLKALGVSEGR